MKVFVGYDESEKEAYKVAVHSLRSASRIEPEIISLQNLRDRGLWTRPVDSRGGQSFDLISGAPCSTDFAISRFLVPIICQSGWAMFADSDVVFMVDPIQVLKFADPSKAVMCVKHNHLGGGTKMVNKTQTSYPRKNWSSVMLFNCDHPANRRLTLSDVNSRPGRDLHAFYWLSDNEIGELPHDWNWLVNVSPKPEHPKIAHFTNGGPWLEGWSGAENDELWLYYYNKALNLEEVANA